jgi:hypothetical protein
MSGIMQAMQRTRSMRKSVSQKEPTVDEKEDAERKLEFMDSEKNSTGCKADVVLIYPLESEALYKEELEEDKNEGGGFMGFLSPRGPGEKKQEKVIDAIEDRNNQRADAIQKLKQAGLTVVKSRSLDGKEMYVKISATLARLKKEAARSEIEMMVDPQVAAREAAEEEHGMLDDVLKKGGCCTAFHCLADTIFGSDSKRTYRDFTIDEQWDFDRIGSDLIPKQGRLFSPLERGRLIFQIIEGAVDMPKGPGAELDLDLLCSEKIFSTYLFMHSPGRDNLAKTWGAMATFGFIKSDWFRLKVNDALCTFLWLMLLVFYVSFVTGAAGKVDVMGQTAPLEAGLGAILIIGIASAALLGMLIQPLDDVRDYFGEKVAFYFGWMEHYSRYLFFLSAFAFLLVLVKTHKDPKTQAWTSLIYCFVVAVWTTLYAEAWKRQTAVLAQIWDVTDFEEEEDPRPEFLASYYRGRWRHDEAGSRFPILLNYGKMEKHHGFYTDDGRFIKSSHPMAPEHKVFPAWLRTNTFIRSVPSMLFCAIIMISGAASIMTFKMMVQFGFASGVPGMVPMVFSTIWITIMNKIYAKVAGVFNDMENYRTETQYNDALILKTVAFQFVNSYITLFYIAFVKSNEVPMGALFGLTDPSTGMPLKDMCAKPLPTTMGWENIKHSNVNPNWAECNEFNFDTPGANKCEWIAVQRDCFEDLKLLMVSYTLLKPCYEIPLQILPTVIAKVKAVYKVSKQMAQMAAEGASAAASGPQPYRNSRGSKMGMVEMQPTKGLSSAPPSPPASPPDEATTADKDRERIDFHGKIAIEKAQKPYGGTFGEYNTKVVQFGYISMFSSAFPLAAISAAVANFIELRIDGMKTLYCRRPRYQGAEDIGSWQGVLNFLSWVALPVNVLILVFTSWEFRTLIIIPWLSQGSCMDPGFDAQPVNVSAPNGDVVTIPASVYYTPRTATGVYTNQYNETTIRATTSFLAPCEQNIMDCFANIGGEAWLPAASFLLYNIVDLEYPATNFSSRYTEKLTTGLCNENFPSLTYKGETAQSLYNKAHCNACMAWVNDVFRWQVFAALLFEHLLLLLKMLLAFLIPDMPRWIIDANARKDFHNEMREVKKRRATTIVVQDNEAIRKELDDLVEKITQSDDVVDDDNAAGKDEPKGRKRMVSDHV